MTIMTKEFYLNKIRMFCEAQKIDGRQNLVYLTFNNFIKELVEERGFDYETLDSFYLYPSKEDIKSENLRQTYINKLLKIAKDNDIKNYGINGYLKACGLKQETINKYSEKFTDKFNHYQCFKEVLDFQEEELYGMFKK